MKEVELEAFSDGEKDLRVLEEREEGLRMF